MARRQRDRALPGPRAPWRRAARRVTRRTSAYRATSTRRRSRRFARSLSTIAHRHTPPRSRRRRVTRRRASCVRMAGMRSAQPRRVRRVMPVRVARAVTLVCRRGRLPCCRCLVRVGPWACDWRESHRQVIHRSSPSGTPRKRQLGLRRARPATSARCVSSVTVPTSRSHPMSRHRSSADRNPARLHSRNAHHDHASMRRRS